MPAVNMKLKDYIRECHSRIESGYFIAALTDEYIVGHWPDQKNDRLLTENESKLLEIRVFNVDRELKLMRGDISHKFLCRCIDDTKPSAVYDYDLAYKDSYDEWQILDIDETVKRDTQGRVTATSGGAYYLPLQKMKDAQIQIRYYLDKYDETGQARVEDWRAVTFANGSKNAGE